MWHLNTLKEKKPPLPSAYTLPAFTVPFKRCNLTISDHREETVTADDDELKITWERRFSGHSVAARPQRNNWGSHGKLPQTKQNNHVYCWGGGTNRRITEEQCMQYVWRDSVRPVAQQFSPTALHFCLILFFFSFLLRLPLLLTQEKKKHVSGGVRQSI